MLDSSLAHKYAFQQTSGDQLVCGTILKASASESVVKVDRRYATQIMGGAEALLYKETEEIAEEVEEVRKK